MDDDSRLTRRVYSENFSEISGKLVSYVFGVENTIERRGIEDIIFRYRNGGLIITGFITRSIFSRNSLLKTELDKKHDRAFNVTLSLRKYRSRRRNLKLLPNCHSKPIGSLFDRDRIELIVRIFSSNLFRSPPMREIINDNIFGFIDGTASEKKGMENVHVDWNICKCNKSDTRWKRMYT